MDASNSKSISFDEFRTLMLIQLQYNGINDNGNSSVASIFNDDYMIKCVNIVVMQKMIHQEQKYKELFQMVIIHMLCIFICLFC